MMIGFGLSAPGSAEPFNFATEFQGEGRQGLPKSREFRCKPKTAGRGKEDRGEYNRCESSPKGHTCRVEILPVSLRGLTLSLSAHYASTRI